MPCLFNYQISPSLFKSPTFQTEAPQSRKHTAMKKTKHTEAFELQENAKSLPALHPALMIDFTGTAREARLNLGWPSCKKPTLIYGGKRLKKNQLPSPSQLGCILSFVFIHQPVLK
jgi:hypothetical protein